MADRYGRRIPLMIEPRVLLGGGRRDRAHAHVHDVPRPARAVRHRHGRRVGRGRVAGDGEGADASARHSLRLPAGGLRRSAICSPRVCFFLVFPRWGWRPMFFIGGLPALLALYVRSHVKESEVWERSRDARLGHLVRSVVVALEAVPVSRVPDGDDELRLARHAGHVSDVPAARLALHAAAEGDRHRDRQRRRDPRRHCSSATSPIAIGRRRTIVIGARRWRSARSRSGPSRRRVPLLVLGAFTMQFMVQGAWGVIPAHINELSPDSVRGFFPGFAYQCGVMIAGSVAYIEAVFAERMTYAQRHGAHRRDGLQRSAPSPHGSGRERTRRSRSTRLTLGAAAARVNARRGGGV